jgi:hypothetical protein
VLLFYFKTALICLVLAVPLVLSIAWLITKIDYRITSANLEVTLWGVCVRRIAISNIRSISARRLHAEEWGEQWWNTHQPSRRFLTLRLRSGLFRYFVITPRHRYVFRSELKAAMANLKLPTPAVEETDALEKDAGEDSALPDEGTPADAGEAEGNSGTTNR